MLYYYSRNDGIDVWNKDVADIYKRELPVLCGEREISINKLATICALSPSSIKNILYEKSKNPKLNTIKMICDGLEIILGESSFPRWSPIRRAFDARTCQITNRATASSEAVAQRVSKFLLSSGICILIEYQ